MAADQTKQRVLDAAGEVFAEAGFQAATVRDICQAAGVNLASINYHFGDKETLYREAVRSAHRRLAEEVPMPAWSPDTPPAEKLRDFVRTLLVRMLSPAATPWPARLMMREVLQPSGACQELVQEHFRPHFSLLLEILDELVPADFPEHRRHQLAFSVVGQCVYYRVAAEVVPLLVSDRELREHYRPEELSEHITEVVLAAVGQEPPLGRRRAAASSAASSVSRRRVSS